MRLRRLLSEVCWRACLRSDADAERIAESVAWVSDTKGCLDVGHRGTLNRADQQIIRDVWSKAFDEDADLVTFVDAGQSPPPFEESERYGELGLIGAPSAAELKWAEDLWVYVSDVQELYVGHHAAQLIAACRWQELLASLTSLTETDSAPADGGITVSLSKATHIVEQVIGVKPSHEALATVFKQLPEVREGYRFDQQLDTITLSRLIGTLMIRYRRDAGIPLGRMAALTLKWVDSDQWKTPPAEGDWEAPF